MSIYLKFVASDTLSQGFTGLKNIFPSKGESLMPVKGFCSLWTEPASHFLGKTHEYKNFNIKVRNKIFYPWFIHIFLYNTYIVLNNGVEEHDIRLYMITKCLQIHQLSLWQGYTSYSSTQNMQYSTLILYQRTINDHLKVSSFFNGFPVNIIT